MSRRTCTNAPRCALLALWTLASCTAALAEDWPHWRGPQRNGISTESSGWEQGRWPAKTMLWQTKLGVGSSSPVVVGDRLFALGWKSGQDTLHCLNADSGETLWQQSYPCPQYGRLSTGDKGLYAGPCSTPEFDPETKLLYTLSIDGDLLAWQSADGKRLWGINLYEKFQVPQRPKVGRSGLRDYGYTTSPLVWQDWLIVEVGSPQQGTLMAFDKRTGELRWKSQDRGPAGHNGGPTPIEVEGVPCVATLSHNGLLVARLDGERAGQTVGTFAWITEFANNTASVTVHADKARGASALITSGYNHYAICKLGISLDGVRQLWQTEECSKVCSPVVYDGHVYWAWNKLYCLDFQTGKKVWEHAGGYSDPGSCIVTADGRLITWTRRGKLTLAETTQRSPQQAKILSEVSLEGRDDAWPHVVLSAGRLFCKDASGALKCLTLDGSQPPQPARPATSSTVSKPAPEVKPAARPTTAGSLRPLDAAESNLSTTPWPGELADVVWAWQSSFGNQLVALQGKKRWTLQQRGQVSLGTDGWLDLSAGAVLQPPDSSPFAQTMKSAEGFTLEAVLQTGNLKQTGPTRILGDSTDAYHRNFSLCQERDQLRLRLRTTATGLNGMKPEVELCRIVANRPIHLVVSYSGGQLNCYVDGEQVLSTKRVQGEFENWSPQQMIWGDELSGDRTWSGKLRRAALYHVAVTRERAQALYESSKVK